MSMSTSDTAKTCRYYHNYTVTDIEDCSYCGEPGFCHECLLIHCDEDYSGLCRRWGLCDPFLEEGEGKNCPRCDYGPFCSECMENHAEQCNEEMDRERG